MADFPTLAELIDNTANKATMQTRFSNFLAACKQLVGADTESTYQLASGLMVPTGAHCVVAAEGAATTDDLELISIANLGSRGLVIVRPTSGQKITIKHRILGTSGELRTSDSSDIILNDPKQFVIFQRVGTYWQEVGRMGLGTASAGIVTAVAGGGTADAITASIPSVFPALFNGLSIVVRAVYPNATTTPTFTLTLGGTAMSAKTICLPGGDPVYPGAIAGAGHWIELTYDTALGKFILANTTPIRSSNIIINGGMQIDQRNSGAAKTITAGSALAYCVDRWYAYCTGANVTAQQVATSDGTGTRLRITGLAGNTGVGLGQRIENENSKDMAGKTIALSLKAKSTSLTTLNFALYYANTADTFGTLASPTRTLISSGSFTISSTEATYKASISAPAGATTGLELVLTCGGLLASQTLEIGEVKLEKGSASPWVYPEIGEELRKCQRYYTVMTGIGVFGYANGASASIISSNSMPVSMRANPAASITVTGTVTSGWNVGIYGTPTNNSLLLQAVSNAAGQGGALGVTVTATAEL